MPTRALRRVLWLVLFCITSAATGRAQAQTASSSRVLNAYPLEVQLAIDGRLSESAWNAAERASDFRQLEPDEGSPASQQTEVRVLYGPSNIYLGALLHDENPDQIVAALGRRDETNRADWFYVALDSYFDQKTAYVFGVNAAGVQFDAIRTGSGGGPGDGMDESWDAVWESDVEITDEGWIAEIRIPYSMLRFSEGDTQTWGIHFTRTIPRLGERSEWPLVPRTERGNLVAGYGLLRGIRNIEPRRNLQVRPYTVSRLQTFESPATPGALDRETSLDVGGDLKVGITSGVTLDATVNPDFGQVESDPAVLNLSAFETFYDEKRPFFLEGTQIYEFSLDRRSDLLYTRRIGARAPIVGAAKLSGRTANGLSFGVLGASTGENLNPHRHYGVARMSQEFGSYSSAGAIVTGFYAPEGTFQRSSVTGGADWDLRFLENTYGIDGYASFTHRRDETGETGFAGSIEGARRQGIWTYNVGLSVFDDDFNPKDLGRLRRNNYISLNAGFRHEINGGRPFGPFQRADLGFFSGQEWSYRNRRNLGFGYFSFSNWTLRGFQRIDLNASAQNIFGGYDLYETRGLGPWAAPGQFEFSAEYRTDERRSWELEPEAGYTYYDDGGRSYEIGFGVDWNVGSRLSVSANADFGWDDDVVAWSSNEAFLRSGGEWLIGGPGRPAGSLDPNDFLAFEGSERLDAVLDDVDFQHVPVFGARDTREFDLTLRSSITFTPGLSVQFYGQLFAARGRYADFQLLRDPETLAPFGEFPKRNEFSLSSFRVNTVLRWEYRPGSTLYVVWTQGRRGRDKLNPLAPWGRSPYNLPFGDQIGETFGIFPENVFLVKIDYTFLR